MAGREMRRASGLVVFRVLGEFQYLLLQASNGTHHWTPPKGHVDPGEDLRQTAVRETQEESGLSPTHYEILEDFTTSEEYTAWGKPKRVDYWLAKLIDPKTPIVISNEHQDFKWVNAATAVSMTYELTGKTIMKAEEFLQNKYPKVDRANPVE